MVADKLGPLEGGATVLVVEDEPGERVNSRRKISDARGLTLIMNQLSRIRRVQRRFLMKQ